MFIDSHCHIGPSNFGEEVDALVQRALDAGLTHLVHIGAGGDTSACHEAMELIENWPMPTTQRDHVPGRNVGDGE